MGDLPWWTIGSPLGKKYAQNQFGNYIQGRNSLQGGIVANNVQDRWNRSGTEDRSTSPVRSYNTNQQETVKSYDTTGRGPKTGTDETALQIKAREKRNTEAESLKEITKDNIDKQTPERLKSEYQKLTNVIYEESDFFKEFNRKRNLYDTNLPEIDALKEEVKRLKGWE